MPWSTICFLECIFNITGVLPGDGESAAEIVHYMNHILNMTNLNQKILSGITLELVIRTHPQREKFAVLDNGKDDV